MKEKIKCKRCRHKISIEKYRSLDYLYCRSCERVLNGGNLPKIQGKVNPKFLDRENRIKQSKPIEYPELPGVYSITCTINKKVYIGQSSNLKNRISGYKKGDKYINPHLKDDIQRYGLRKFIFKIEETLPDSTEDQRLDIEAFYKAKYPFDQLYNILPGKESKEEYEKWKTNQ